MVNDDDGDIPLAKSQIPQEECRIKELQIRMEELTKRVNIGLQPSSSWIHNIIERNPIKMPKEDSRSRAARSALRRPSFFPSRREILDYANRTVSHAAFRR